MLVCKNKKWSFAADDYDAFMQLIPDKELSVVQAKRAAETAKTEPSASDRLKELRMLLDDGLITQAEYDAKRAEILKDI